jgi:nucleotide-binding universal stress UspA family protein
VGVFVCDTLKMIPAKTVLLASHGTDGAMAAEKMALSLCKEGTALHHLLVVPTLWEGMTGDDWLNNGSTRDTFRRYLESELGKEVDEHCERISSQAEAMSVIYTNELIVGEPDECLLDTCKNQDFELVVLGSPRPKGIKGLRSRMSTKSIFKSLTIPLLIVPYPQ